MKIIAETPEYIVVEKPSGLLVHADAHHPNETTLVDLLVAHYPALREVGDDAVRPGLVHRLDKDVSGIMVIAKTQMFFEALKKQFQNRTIAKEYRALIHGKLTRESGIINFPIDHAKDKGMMAALPRGSMQGREAITEFEVLKSFTHASYIAVFPKTGRTHQIRVHFFACGHPVVGDPLYNNRPPKKLDIAAGRIMLHAYSLSFDDAEGKRVTFTSPLPVEFERVIEKLK